MNKLELHIPKSRWHHHLYKLNYKYPMTIEQTIFTQTQGLYMYVCNT